MTGASKAKSITITVRAHDDLKSKAAQSTQLIKDLGAERKKSGKLEKTVEKLTQQLENSVSGNANFGSVIAQKDKVIKELKALVADLQSTLRKNGNVHPSELNRELAEQTFHAAKIYLSRTVRWFGDHDDAEHHTRSLIQYLPKGKESLGGLSEEEYGFKYRQTANKGLQACKQNVQSEGKKAARGT
jgi:ABC-type transporter Mla subunit MlaD